MDAPASWSDHMRQTKLSKVTLPWAAAGLTPDPVHYVTRYAKVREEVAFNPVLGVYTDSSRVRQTLAFDCARWLWGGGILRDGRWAVALVIRARFARSQGCPRALSLAGTWMVCPLTTCIGVACMS
jgi:hypothetical protein